MNEKHEILYIFELSLHLEYKAIVVISRQNFLY